ncbi:hypothetical protein [uncultured Paracoccus sp.]|uniref:hypothetical protein n=1 Tax=uncultured Paracoccus sp. TaxID=189685 RepID=UPI0025E34D2C|nr:hypothetical protein [uncultured Paracoccus sp.]
MGFRPAVHVIQRDQYGDHMALVVGDDSPMQGKVPPGFVNHALSVDPYAPLGGAGTTVMAALSPGSSGGNSGGIASLLGGGGGGYIGGGSSGRGTDSRASNQKVWPDVLDPGIDEVSSAGSEGGYKPKPTDPVIKVPDQPDLPPLAPVPLPDAAPLLIASLLAFAVLRRVRG